MSNDESATQQAENERLAERIQRMERVMEISRNLNSTLDINLLLGEIVQAAAELTDTEAASILLMDSTEENLQFEASITEGLVSLGQITVPIESSIAGWVVTNGEPMIIDDVSNEPRWSSSVDDASEFRTRSLLAVPMRTRDNVIGCLEGVNKRYDAGFSEDDVEMLTTLAAHAAVAIQNARLFEQSDLIAEMVHELRTPLAAIKATTHIILRPEIGEDRRKDMVDTIAQETDRLTRMTTEFLDLARMESGRKAVVKEPFDLGELLSRTVETVRPQANDRNLTLTVDLRPAALPQVVGDREKLGRVVLNLLTNAIKYNRESGAVYVRGIKMDDYIQVEVEDTGLGISEQNLPHLFEKFYRVADTEGYTQGTGLGLAITRRIVEMHGGEIWVESTLGEGTNFLFTLPLSDDE